MPTAKRVLVLGASGIVGQHLRLFEPQDCDVCYQSRAPLPWADVASTYHAEFTTEGGIRVLLDHFNPDIVINLVGENRPDVVEQAPERFDFINVALPGILAHWADTRSGRWLVHVSSQAIFGGECGPYAPEMPAYWPHYDAPVNAYGRQKVQAEDAVLACAQTLVVRLTFVLGVRPFPHCGRVNPLEAMFASSHVAKQVNDRWFSICWATDAARGLWELVGTLDPLDPLLDRYLTRRRILHLGGSTSYTRYELAVQAAMQMEALARGDAGHRVLDVLPSTQIEPVKHDDAFPPPQFARRPVDTTFAPGSLTYTGFDEGLRQAAFIWRHTVDLWSLTDRAKELALYFNMPEGPAQTELLRGFGHLHAEVAKDFRAAQHRVRADASRGLTPSSGWDMMRLLQWYKATDRYCWELTAYHLDVGFNYKGMCDGIVTYCQQHNFRRVLVLGDGVGDLSMLLQDAGLAPIYHDLLASVTARFALFRMARRYGLDQQAVPRVTLTEDWRPPRSLTPGVAGADDTGSVDAVVALDFFEHLPNVPDWARYVADVLVPGGHFLAQNAFGIGDDAHEGSIPMHLVENNKYVTEWPALLTSLGLTLQPSGWWQKA